MKAESAKGKSHDPTTSVFVKEQTFETGIETVSVSDREV
jgi:hypothetical protein